MTPIKKLVRKVYQICTKKLNASSIESLIDFRVTSKCFKDDILMIIYTRTG